MTQKIQATSPSSFGLVDQRDLPDHEMTVGVLMVQGEGFRVAAVTNGVCRHMTWLQARILAKDLEAGEHGEQFKPVVEALRATADRVLMMVAPVGSDE